MSIHNNISFFFFFFFFFFVFFGLFFGEKKEKYLPGYPSYLKLFFLHICQFSHAWKMLSEWESSSIIRI